MIIQENGVNEIDIFAEQKQCFVIPSVVQKRYAFQLHFYITKKNMIKITKEEEKLLYVSVFKCAISNLMDR